MEQYGIISSDRTYSFIYFIYNGKKGFYEVILPLDSE